MTGMSTLLVLFTPPFLSWKQVSNGSAFVVMVSSITSGVMVMMVLGVASGADAGSRADEDGQEAAKDHRDDGRLWVSRGRLGDL